MLPMTRRSLFPKRGKELPRGRGTFISRASRSMRPGIRSLQLLPVLSYETARIDRLDLPGDARLVTHAFPLVDSIVTRCGHWNEIGARVLPAKIGSASRRAAGVRFSANEVCAIVAKPNFAVHTSEGSAFFDECARSIRRESEKPARLRNKDGGYGPHMIVVANTCTKRSNILSQRRRYIRHGRNECDCGRTDRAYDGDALREAPAERGAWGNIKPVPQRVDLPLLRPFLYRLGNPSGSSANSNASKPSLHASKNTLPTSWLSLNLPQAVSASPCWFQSTPLREGRSQRHRCSTRPNQRIAASPSFRVISSTVRLWRMVFAKVP
jgi:hypothetical protein